MFCKCCCHLYSSKKTDGLQARLPAASQSLSSPFQMDFPAPYSGRVSTDQANGRNFGQSNPASSTPVSLADQTNEFGSHIPPLGNVRGDAGEPQDLPRVPHMGPGPQWASQQESLKNGMPGREASSLEKNLAGAAFLWSSLYTFGGRSLSVLFLGLPHVSSAAAEYNNLYKKDVVL